MKKILISFPTSPAHPYLHKGVVFTSWKLLADKRYELLPIIPTHNPFSNNLNLIVKDFISGGHDYWLSIDADNPPMKNPLDLVELDLDIVGCPTPVWRNMRIKGEPPVYYNALDYDSEKGAYRPTTVTDGLKQVDAIGTGCFLVARRVFEDPEMIGSFMRQWNDDGTVEKGNDIAFSEKARIQGWRIWAHFGYMCMHFNSLEINEVCCTLRDFFKGSGEI